MIFEKLDSPTAQLLAKQFPAVRAALDWIRSLPPNPANGIVELPLAGLSANIHGYSTLTPAQCKWESHRHMIDIQYCLSGGELIDWMPAGSLQPMNDYNVEKDSEHWQSSDAPPRSIRMEPGFFVLFLNGEIHRPKVADGAHSEVHKLVIKIPSKLLKNLA